MFMKMNKNILKVLKALIVIIVLLLRERESS